MTLMILSLTHFTAWIHPTTACHCCALSSRVPVHHKTVCYVPVEWTRISLLLAVVWGAAVTLGPQKWKVLAYLGLHLLSLTGEAGIFSCPLRTFTLEERLFSALAGRNVA